MNVAQIVTDKILLALKNGTPPWKKTWVGGAPHNAATGKDYRGVNSLLLDGGGYMTYNQAKSLGGVIEPGTPYEIICFYSRYTKKKKDGTESIGSVLKYYKVFSVQKIKNLDKKYYGITRENEVRSDVEQFVSALELKIDPGRPAYFPATHRITMPSIKSFDSSDCYYATLFHEIIHWTMKPLERKNPEYAFEELVAEIGSGMLCTIFGIKPNDPENMEAYCAHWIQHIKEDGPSAIMKAASAAQKGVDYCLSKSTVLVS